MLTRTLWALALGGAVGLWACDDAESPAPSESTQGRKAALEGIARGAIQPAVAAFRVTATALRDAAAAHAAAGGEDEATLAALRTAWHAAMDAWQRLEPMQVGPAASSLVDARGQDLRDLIYSWPTTNPCLIDQEIVRQGYAEPAFFDAARVNGHGLDAIEHLLFRRDDANLCPPQVLINSEGTWRALDQATRQQRRADYASALAAAVVGHADTLDAAWRDGGLAFGDDLADGTAYGSVQAGLDAVFAGLFYLDQQVKDLKLGQPLGIYPGCATDTCPELFESVLSGRVRANLVANLRGARQIFTGGEGLGFDDLLVAEGAETLSREMLAHIDAALAAADALPEDLVAALGASDPRVEALHAAVRLITDDLKSDFVTTLNLSLPDRGAADND